VVRSLAESLWKALATEHGIDREDRSTWRVSRPFGFQAWVRSDAFSAMATPGVLELLDDLFGPCGWERPRHWGQPLVCFPSPEARWEVPRRHWHLDLPEGQWGFGLPGVRIFVLLDRVETHAGSTCFVAGSHLLVQRVVGESRGVEPLSSARMRKALARRSSWIRALLAETDGPERTARLLAGPSRTMGIELRLAEIVGEPGDVFVMDLRLLHAPAPNCGSAPRLVLGQAIHAEGGRSVLSSDPHRPTSA